MRIFLASLASALILFFFGFAWWGVLMPIVRPASSISDQALVDQMAKSLDSSALYFYPDFAEPSEDPTQPMAMLYYNTSMPSMSTTMGMGFAHMFATALLVSLFVSCVPLRSFGGRLAFLFCLGLFVALWADVGNMIWWRHPVPWMAFHFGYDALSWLLAGIVIAAMVKPSGSGAARAGGLQ